MDNIAIEEGRVEQEAAKVRGQSFNSQLEVMRGSRKF